MRYTEHKSTIKKKAYMKINSCIAIIIIIIRRFIKRRSEAEGKGAVHVFNVLAAIIRKDVFWAET